MSEEMNSSIERILFSILSQSHMELGGGIGFRGKKWLRGEANSYLGIDDKGVLMATWGKSMDAVQSLFIEIQRERRKLDEVYFFFQDDRGSYEGVTWRMLKIDMSFLRIALDKDQMTMREIIKRFVRISEKAQSGEDEPFQNVN